MGSLALVKLKMISDNLKMSTGNLATCQRIKHNRDHDVVPTVNLESANQESGGRVGAASERCARSLMGQ